MQNPHLEGLALQDLLLLERLGVVVSRLRRAGRADVEAVRAESRLHVGDLVLSVGPQRALDEFQRTVGARAADVPRAGFRLATDSLPRRHELANGFTFTGS
jgi:uncharacterized transporter YbjL